MPKFAEVSCSQCGEAFGPGDHGYSHCDDHRLDALIAKLEAESTDGARLVSDVIASRDQMRAALNKIVSLCPAEKPEPAYQAGYGYRSEGNQDDVASDCVADALWEVSEAAVAGTAAVERAELGLDGNCAFALLGDDIQSGESVFVQIETAGHEAERRAAIEAFKQLRQKLGKPISYYFGPSYPLSDRADDQSSGQRGHDR